MRSLREVYLNIRFFFLWLKTSFQYSIFLWNNSADYDYVYLLTLMKFKLERMRHSIENGYHLHRDKTAKRIKYCEVLIDRIIKDRYCEYEFNELDKKWGKLKLNLEKKKESSPRSVKSIITRPGIETEKDEKEERETSRRLWMKAEKLKKEDINNLFKIMSKHITTWWD